MTSNFAKRSRTPSVLTNGNNPELLAQLPTMRAQLIEAGVRCCVRAYVDAQDPFVESVLGTELTKELVRNKRAEWEQYHQSVSQREIDRYARLF